MARFVEFQCRIGKPVWINPDCVVGVAEQDGGTVGIFGADGDSPWIVPGTVAEVLAKLQDDQQPEPQAAKAGDDITGWWLENVTGAAIHVIGQDYYGSWVYEMEESLLLRSHPDVITQHYFRDPNRKGWEG